MQETPVQPEGNANANAAPRPTSTMKIRLDHGSRAGTDLAPGSGSLLGAFGSWGGGQARQEPPVQDRRSEARQSTAEGRVRVGWKVWGRLRTTDALVVNISRGGALIFLDHLPPPSSYRPIWVFLETSGEKKAVKARIHERRETAAGQCLAHVEFSEPCPYAFFEAAVCGQAASDPKTRPARPGPGPTPVKPSNAG